MDKKQIEDYKEIIASLGLDSKKKRAVEVLWLNFAHLMDELTMRNYYKYNIMNIITILCGLSVPVLVSFSDSVPIKVITAILGIFAGAGSAINQSYKFNDRWKHFRRIAEEMKIEGANFIALAKPYRKHTHEEAFQDFIENVNQIKNQQIDEYINKINNSLSADQNASLSTIANPKT